MTIRRIDPASLSKVLGVLYAILGVIGGALLTVVSAAGGGIASSLGIPGPARGLFSLLFGVGAIVVLPICYGLFGWIGGWIIAALYNWVARRFGGIVLVLE